MCVTFLPRKKRIFKQISSPDWGQGVGMPLEQAAFSVTLSMGLFYFDHYCHPHADLLGYIAPASMP